MDELQVFGFFLIGCLAGWVLRELKLLADFNRENRP